MVCFFAVGVASADVAMSPIFSNDMVLQRDRKLSVWGTADPGEAVSITAAGQTKKTQADNQGHWMVHLDPLKAGGPFTVTVKGKNTLRFENVLAGDVWLCGGQSNMAMRVQASMNWPQELAASEHPNIRLFRVTNRTAPKPTKALSGRWYVCGKKTVANFTAVGYFFGRKLHKELNVPIGLIHSNWGGTPARSWTSRKAMEADPAFKKAIIDPADKALVGYDAKKKAFDAVRARWLKEFRKARAEKRKPPRRPRAPYGPDSAGYPAVLYNAMIHPLIPYGIKGALWYQGEADAGRWQQYRRLLPAMIRCWRDEWGQGPFPFYIVQLANFMSVKPQPAPSSWAALRESQMLTATNVPHCGIACIIDLGETRDIHPKNKQDVGKRLARVALAKTYGKDVVYSGPVFDAMKVEGATVRVTFKHVGGGLVTRTSDMPSASNYAKADYKLTFGDGPVKGFAVAGADKKFVWAEAKLEGNVVVLSAKEVTHPVAVRYAWADNPVCNLYNREGLPAVPFRTDDW